MDCVIYFSLPVLRESIYCCMADQAKYKQLLNSLEEAAVMLDRSGKVLHSNPIFRELAGLQKPESAAMTDIFPEIPESWLADSLQAGDVAAFKEKQREKNAREQQERAREEREILLRLGHPVVRHDPEQP